MMKTAAFFLPLVTALVLQSGSAREAPLPGPDDPVMAGYDLVEYHNLDSQQDGVLGSVSFSYRHSNGYLYYFSNEENKQAFIADTERYLPKYGGFCAWGIAWEYPSDGWPWAADHMGPPCGPRDGWAVLDGRLYCSIWRSYQDDFNRKQEEGIRLADQRWIGFYGSLDGGPQNNGCYAWNWQECFQRSIHDAVSPTTPAPVPLDQPTPPPTLPPDALPDFTDEETASWSTEKEAMEGTVKWKWTLENVTTTEIALLVEISTTNVASDEYIAFGVAEQLMQGPLVACSDREGRAVCSTLVGDGMGTTVPENDPVNPTVLFSSRNSTHFTVQFSALLLGFWSSPRLPARVLFAMGKVAGDGAPQPHLNDARNREAVMGIDFLSAVEGYNVDENRPDVDPPAQLEPLPDRTLWQPVDDTSGVTTILDGRIHVAYELFSHNDGEEDIVMIQLQNIEFVADSYIGFGFAEEVMNGLIITCSIEDGLVNRAVCKQWRGRGTNIWPRARTDPGGWFVSDVVSNGTHVNYTFVGRVAEVFESQQIRGGLSELDNVRAICAIGRLTSDTKNPLQHYPLDRAGFQLAGLGKVSGEPKSVNDESGGGVAIGAIVGGVAGGIVLVAYCTLYMLDRRRQQKPPSEENDKPEVDTSQGGDSQELDSE